jgi:hypothetical protein
VSLNRSEQQLFEYIEVNRDERQFWQNKVRACERSAKDLADAARILESELWRYLVERSQVVPDFKNAVPPEGLRRLSMRNLAEYLLRVWTPPRPKKPNPPTQFEGV